MDCAICLNHIERKQEAYLYPCGHFFCFRCISEWTERQRQHAADQECAPEQRCNYACPLCKTAYTYIAYDCLGSSCRLMPMCGQPKTMSAIPLSPEQSRRRALYVTPQQLTPARQVQAKRPRSPIDKEVTAFVQRELQAILLTGDVDIIVQHIAGILQNMTNNFKAHAGKTSSISSPGMYGDQADFLQNVSKSMQGFLNDHSKAFAEHLYAFIHSGLTVAGYDRLIFGSGETEETEVPHSMMGEGADTEAGVGQEW